MTEDERTALKQLRSDMGQVKTQQAEIHGALFKVAPGSPPDEVPLIETLFTMARAYKRASWLTRMLMILVPTVTGATAVVLGYWEKTPWGK